MYDWLLAGTYAASGMVILYAAVWFWLEVTNDRPAAKGDN